MKKDILLATNNIGKVKELQDMLGENYNVLTLKDINCDIDVVEDGLTPEFATKMKKYLNFCK